MEEITSRDNKKIKHIVQLYKRKYRTTHQEFVAEGYRTVIDMLPTGTVRYVIVNTESIKQDSYIHCYLYVRPMMCRYVLFQIAYGKGLKQPCMDQVSLL